MILYLSLMLHEIVSLLKSYHSFAIDKARISALIN